MKYLHITICSFVALALAVPVMAMPERVEMEHGKTGNTLRLPAQVVETAPQVFSLGSAVDPQTSKVVEGIAIVHPRKEFHHRPDHSKGNKGGGGAGSKCYAFIAKGAAWNTAEQWRVNPANIHGLGDAFVVDTMNEVVDEWENAVDGGAAIFGNYEATFDALVADTESPDGQNEVYFGSIDDPGAIAVTIIWGVFSGAPSKREILEWDMVFDQIDYNWAGNGTSTAMDFENIAQHEVGHALGLTHPDDSCVEETMYRFATEGETKKRDLEVGDIEGVNQLY